MLRRRRDGRQWTAALFALQSSHAGCLEGVCGSYRKFKKALSSVHSNLRSSLEGKIYCHQSWMLKLNWIDILMLVFDVGDILCNLVSIVIRSIASSTLLMCNCFRFWDTIPSTPITSHVWKYWMIKMALILGMTLVFFPNIFQFCSEISKKKGLISPRTVLICFQS